MIRSPGLKKVVRELETAAERRLVAEVRRNVRRGAKVFQRASQDEIGGSFTDPQTKRARKFDDDERPPNRRQLGEVTGRLKRAITLSIRIRNRRSYRAEIGPEGLPAVYGTVHELGRSPFPERPFLAPAKEKKEEKVFRILGRSVRVVP